MEEGREGVKGGQRREKKYQKIPEEGSTAIHKVERRQGEFER